MRCLDLAGFSEYDLHLSLLHHAWHFHDLALPAIKVAQSATLAITAHALLFSYRYYDRDAGRVQNSLDKLPNGRKQEGLPKYAATAGEGPQIRPLAERIRAAED